ncbi:glycosyltransferase family 4 protein [Halosquirtibacter xylanolyticus]|uniref:glycosyltransferase family 4 protein n=1 Tax=Halosquirtibacter xylanolyticus TaxID=3374599 RepID=UPI00374A90EC|nr:glycosyltransferase family 4 protein [Prolixibacteraceae bacterium]
MSQKSEQRVIVCNTYSKPFIGGIESSLFYISNSLIEDGEDVIILASDRTPSGVRAESGMEEGVWVERFVHPNRIWLLFEPLILVFTFWRYLKKKKWHKETRVICRSHLMVMSFLLYGMKNIVYVVPSIVERSDTHVSHVLTGLDRFKDLIIRHIVVRQHIFIQNRVLKKSPFLMVLSRLMQNEVASIVSRDDISMCPPGVDHSRFFPSKTVRQDIRKRLGIEKRFVYLCVGRVVSIKCFPDILHALNLMSPCIREKISVLIVGDGLEYNDLKRMVRQFKLDGCVHLLGASQRPEDYYKAADCFLMTSICEPFGQTITESLASGIPVIAYKGEGVVTASEDILEDGYNGFFCTRDTMSLKETMLSVQDMSKAAFQEVKQHCVASSYSYSWAHFAKACLDLVSKG